MTLVLLALDLVPGLFLWVAVPLLVVGAVLAAAPAGWAQAGKGSLVRRLALREEQDPGPAGAGSQGMPDGHATAAGTRGLLASIAWPGLGILVALAPLLRDTLVGPLLGLLLLSALLVLLVLRWGRLDRALGVLLLAALALRVLLLAADLAFDLFPKADAVGYHRGAAMLADAWWFGEAWRYQASSNVAAYVHAIAPLYLLFGPNPLLPRLLAILLGVATMYNVFRIGERFLSRRAALAGAAIVALLPSLAQLQTENLRDPLILFLITALFRMLLSKRLTHIVAFLGAGAALMLVFLLREPTVVVLGLPVLILAVFRLRPRSEEHQVPLLSWAGTAAVAALLFLVVSSVGVTEWTDPAIIEGIRANWAEGGSAYLTNVRFDSWWDVAFFAPLGAVYFLLTPFPWQVHNLLALIATVENLLVFYPAVALAAVYAWRNRHRREVLALALFLLIGAALYGLIEGNVGTAIRHRAQFTWVALLLAGAPIAAWLQRAQTRPQPQRVIP